MGYNGGAGGRPLKFASPEELQEKINLYFANCDDRERPYTLAGLAYYLDCDTDTLRNYSFRDEYFGTIKKARQKIEVSKAEKLESKYFSTAGLIFDLLNNHGYTNKQQQDHTSSDGSMTPSQIDLTKLDDSTLKKIMEATNG